MNAEHLKTRRLNTVAATLILLGAVGLGSAAGPTPLRAAPVATILAGSQPDGTRPFLRDLVRLWERMNDPSPHRLATDLIEPVKFRLRALERGRGHFAILDTAQAILLLGEHKRVVALGLLWPNYLYAMTSLPRLNALSLPLSNPVAIAESASYVHEGLTEWSLRRRGQSSLLRLVPRVENPAQWAAQTEGVALFSAPAPLAEVGKVLREHPGLRILPISNSLTEKLQLLYPWLQTEILPQATYSESGGNLSLPVRHMLMVGRIDLEELAVRKMLKSLYQMGGIMKPVNPLFGQMNMKLNAVFSDLLPFHPESARVFGFPVKEP